MRDISQILAESVCWIREEARCPDHEFVALLIITPDGPMPWVGPACEVPGNPLGMECQFIANRDNILERCFTALGTKDMSNFL